MHKLYIVLREIDTISFLTEQDREEWLNHWVHDPKDAICVEADVTEEQWARLVEWSGQ